jgi:hypothetical protein
MLHLLAVKVVMVAFHVEAEVVAVQELQLAAQAVKVRQVKLEFGVGNDTKQHNTNT